MSPYAINNQTCLTIFDELYLNAFKNYGHKTPDEIFIEILHNMCVSYNDSDITILSVVYTSLGELFENKFNDTETFFDYFDLTRNKNKELFQKHHINFILNITNEIKKLNYDFQYLAKIGCMSLLGNQLINININKKFSPPFSKALLCSMIEEQSLVNI